MMSGYCFWPWCRRSTNLRAASSNKVISLAICSLKMLEDDIALITTKRVSFKIGITTDLKQVFKNFKEDYKTPSVPEKGIAVVQGESLSDAKVTAYYPFFTTPENFDVHLADEQPSQEQALALYTELAQHTEWFEESVSAEVSTAS